LIGAHKDSRHLWKAYQDGWKNGEFSIDYLIDFSLENRPNLKALVEAEMPDPNTQLITTEAQFKALVDKAPEDKLFDIALFFDEGYEVENHLFDGEMVLNEPDTLTEAIDLLNECYIHYRDNVSADPVSAEYNFRWTRQTVGYLVYYFVYYGYEMCEAHWQPLPLHILDKMDDLGQVQYKPLDVFIDFRYSRKLGINILNEFLSGYKQVPVRVIIGTDWGVGKTNYLLNRRTAGDGICIAGDMWYLLTSKYYLPATYTTDWSVVKGFITGEIAKAYKDFPNDTMYVKIDGRLEEYIWGIPRDKRSTIEGMHTYFEDFKFLIIMKTGQHPDDADLSAMREDFKAYIRY
jgi:hypothetical protein